jgi:hypothetical protein
VTTSSKPPMIKGGVHAGAMQPRSHNRRHGLIGTVPLALLLAACGTTAATTTHSSSPTPTPTPTATPTLVPTPVPTPSEPVLGVLQYNACGGCSPEGLRVINAQGATQWSLTGAQINAYLGLTGPEDTISTGLRWFASYVVAGPNIILLGHTQSAKATTVVVFSRTGALLGKSTMPFISGAVFSPDGTQWAWLVDQSPASQSHHGVINMGGLGEPNRTVFHWLAPADNVEALEGWTNTGIIIHREQYLGVDCNIFYQPGSAWFALNPHTGTLTQLADGNKVALLGASSNDIVAASLSDAHAVLINGVNYSESKSQVTSAFVSPDGSYVAVDRYSQTRCDLNAEGGKNTVEMVNVASKTHVDLQNLSAIAWLGSTEFVANPPDGSTWLYSLSGRPITDICPVNSMWSYAGELT